MEEFGEFERVALRESAFESDRDLAVFFVDVDQVEKAQYAKRPFVERHAALAKDRGYGVVPHKRRDVADRPQIVAERFLSFFAPLFEIEFIRRLEDGLKSLAQAFAAVERVV